MRAPGSLMPSEEIFAGNKKMSGERRGAAEREKHGERDVAISECREGARLKKVVDDTALGSLHPWVVASLVDSKIQFPPSVPQTRRYSK